MRVIDIDPVPNQEFTITTPDGNRWGFTIKQATTSMIANIDLNDVRILSGIILPAETPIIPYRFLQSSGNFVFLTEGGELPNWERFGIDQILVYASPEDIAEARGTT